MHFIFQGQEYSIKVGRQDCEQLQGGQTVHLLHLDTHPDIFLFPGYYNSSEGYSWVALFLFGCYAFISSLKRLQKEHA